MVFKLKWVTEHGDVDENEPADEFDKQNSLTLSWELGVLYYVLYIHIRIFLKRVLKCIEKTRLIGKAPGATAVANHYIRVSVLEIKHLCAWVDWAMTLSVITIN